MVIDDETDARELVTTALEPSGAIVRSATVKEALEAIQQHLPDLLISDIGLPEADGYALIRQIRAQSYLIPAIALTADAGIEHREHAIAAGFQRHLEKPFQPDKLVAIAVSLVGRA